jgi:hypothetical protein
MVQRSRNVNLRYGHRGANPRKMHDGQQLTGSAKSCLLHFMLHNIAARLAAK